MRHLGLLPALAVGLICGQALAAPVVGRLHVEDRSLVQADGGRLLSEAITIKAPRQAVWEAFATTQGLLSWEAPVAAIDLRVGGVLEATYDAKGRLGDPGNIKHEVLGYLPGELLVFRNIQAPPFYCEPMAM